MKQVTAMPPLFSPSVSRLVGAMWIVTAVTIVSCGLITVHVLDRAREAIPARRSVRQKPAPRIQALRFSTHHVGCSYLAAGRDSDAATSESRAPAARWPGITPLGGDDYAVDRALIRDWVAGRVPRAMLRIVPVVPSGRFIGIELLASQPSSIPAALALQDRDQLRAINGATIEDEAQLMDIYRHLDELGAIELTGLRGGRLLRRTLYLR